MSRLRELLESLSADYGLVVQAVSPHAILITEHREEESLTKRESAVLRLVAQGLTNGQIARRLEISPRTVEKHVENARGKLGAANRTEAALLSYGMTA
ncbi:response regulator transcription factor [Nonomuraea sp. NPDC050556]|uniref:response regulator transcription factor n=1 Tax=Nonomuraea sp. NPDC050556 TaxID=3364369 RepID=UPI0037B3E0D2